MKFVKTSDLPKTAEFQMAGRIQVTDTGIYVEMLARVACNLFDKDQVAVVSADYNPNTTEKNPLQIRDDEWSFPKSSK